MAVSKVILNGTTLIDTTDKTVTAADMLSGKTALKNDGTTATGTISSKTSSNLTVSGATVTAPAGYYASDASASVQSVTAGTPTATKGTVSNNAVTVTPSVTNPTGYINGGTKTGTAVTVSASELVSGTVTVTENGTVDVTNYASAEVNVSGGGGGSYTVEINLVRPVNPSSFRSCTIYDWNEIDGDGSQIGTISAADGSATVVTSMGGIRLEFSGSYVVPPTGMNTDIWVMGHIGFSYAGDGSTAEMRFVVGSDGAIDITGIDWDD